MLEDRGITEVTERRGPGAQTRREKAVNLLSPTGELCYHPEIATDQACMPLLETPLTG